MNLFDAIFKYDPSSVAIVFNDREITYGDLKNETLAMVAVILNQGVSKGDRVALLLNDSPEFVEAFIAIATLGAIVVPINIALTVDEQCSILHNSGARVVLIESDQCNKLLTVAPEKLQSLHTFRGCARERE